MTDEEKMEELTRILRESPDVPEHIKEMLVENLPSILENVGELARVVYDPNKIWLEAIQFADYVEQHLEHLANEHDEECRQDSLDLLKKMSAQFKRMAESAMSTLDALNINANLVDFSTVEIKYNADDEDEDGEQ